MNPNEIIRDMIKHENYLINTRMGWLMTLQGILFGSLGVFYKEEVPSLYFYVLASTGIIISILTVWGVASATCAIHNLEKWYHDHTADFSSYPPVIGIHCGGVIVSDKLSKSNFRNVINFMKKHVTPWQLILVVFVAAWILILKQKNS